MSVKVEDEGNHGCPRPGRSSVRNIALGLAETLNLNVTFVLAGAGPCII